MLSLHPPFVYCSAPATPTINTRIDHREGDTQQSSTYDTGPAYLHHSPKLITGDAPTTSGGIRHKSHQDRNVPPVAASTGDPNNSDEQATPLQPHHPTACPSHASPTVHTNISYLPATHLNTSTHKTTTKSISDDQPQPKHKVRITPIHPLSTHSTPNNTLTEHLDTYKKFKEIPSRFDHPSTNTRRSQHSHNATHLNTNYRQHRPTHTKAVNSHSAKIPNLDNKLATDTNRDDTQSAEPHSPNYPNHTRSTDPSQQRHPTHTTSPTAPNQAHLGRTPPRLTSPQRSFSHTVAGTSSRLIAMSHDKPATSLTDQYQEFRQEV